MVTNTTSNVMADIQRARSAGVPLVGVITPDSEALSVKLQGIEDPAIRWDSMKGWSALNNSGLTAIKQLFGDLLRRIVQSLQQAGQPVDENEELQRLLFKETGNPITSMTWALKLPSDSVLYYSQPQRALRETAQAVGPFSQGILNLRNSFAATGRTLILAGVELSMPAELRSDVLIIREALPTRGELAELITEMEQANETLEFTDIERGNVTDALRGLARFPAEQALAIGVIKASQAGNGAGNVDSAELWARKCQMVEETPGLSIFRGSGGFAGIGGCERVKKYSRAILTGKRPPKVIVFIDEGEKAFAGATAGTSDSTGVSQNILMAMLKEMQDTNARGMVFLGPAGAAKSAMAKAIGFESGILTINFDLSAMKASLVGQSEAQLRRALDVVAAVGDGEPLYVMTCNKDAALPPELKRRFKRGMFYFDLPTREERQLIWNIYLDKYDLHNDQTLLDVDDTDWTGAEIEQCAETAWELGFTLKEASEFVVPVAKSAANELAALRAQATGVYLSASYAGAYRGAGVAEEGTPVLTYSKGGRKLRA